MLDGLIGAVRSGESRALAAHGEPGVGKTALLDYLAGHAPGGQRAAMLTPGPDSSRAVDVLLDAAHWPGPCTG